MEEVRDAGSPIPETGEKLAGGVAAIVLVGIVLGIAQNALMRRGEDLVGLKEYQRRSLSWVREEVVLPSLAEYQPVPSAVAGDAPAVSSPVGRDEPVPEASPADGTAAPLPLIPALPHPIEMHLSAVKAFFDRDAAAIVDARTPEEFAEGHIPGAVNLSYDQAITDPQRLESFDAKGRPIIVYCGGGACETSMNLAFAMIQAGQKRLLVFMGGFPEWSEAGYPVAGAGRGGAS